MAEGMSRTFPDLRLTVTDIDPTMVAALAETSRVLRPGGVFIGYDLDRTRPATWIHVLDRSPYHLIDHHELRSALDEAGFRDVQTRRSLWQHATQFTAVKSESWESRC